MSSGPLRNILRQTKGFCPYSVQRVREMRRRKRMQPLDIEQEPEPIRASTALIEVEHLSRSIGSGARKTIILDDVTFRVPTRSLFAITGPSGSGKSTILNMRS